MTQKQPKIRSELAVAHMVRQVSLCTADEKVSAVVQRIQNPRNRFDVLDYTYVVDNAGHLVGVVSIKELLGAHGNVSMQKIMKEKLIVAHVNSDQEYVAKIALKHGIKSVPIVNKDHRFLGVVPPDVIFKILKWEHTEDMLRLSGVHGSGLNYRNISEISSFKMSLLRIPSILLGLMGGIFATSVVNFFESSLEKNIILAFFIPLIVYMNDAVGTQTETILVRQLGAEQVNIWKYLAREIFVGFFIGLTVGLCAFVITIFMYQSLVVALTIGISLLVGITSASIVAIIIPYTLFALKKDPAISGGPFTTVLQDILSLLIFFTVASLILH